MVYVYIGQNIGNGDWVCDIGIVIGVYLFIVCFVS